MLIAAVVLVGATAAVGWLPFALALPAFLLATAGYLWLLRGALGGAVRLRFGAALLVAALLRAVCLPQPFALSDDVYRYVHEGRMVLAGHNPYAVAPSDAPAELRDAVWENVNNPDIPAAYPPAVMYAFALGVAVWSDPIVMKILFGSLDLLAFVVLWFGLPHLGLPSERAVVHGWCPLLAVEFAGQAHNDSLTVLGLALSMVAVAWRRPALTGVALAVATAGKLIPLVLLPFALRGRRWWLGALSFGVVLAVLYAPFAENIGALAQGTEQYSRRWRSNDSLYAPLAAAAKAIEDAGWLRGFDSPWLREGQGIAKLPLALFGVLVLGWCWWRRYAYARVGAVFFTFFLALAPTVHPWYLGLLLPFLCVHFNWGLAAFSGTAFLAYHVLPGWQAGEGWNELWWVKVIEYVPFYVGVAWAIWRSSRGGVVPAPSRMER
ncbi:MAG: glycosyltransferase family 87 protein [Planctomycetota bacterium]